MALRVEERVAYVEGQVTELSQRLSGVETAIRDLRERTETRFDALDTKMSRQLIWLVGIEISTLIAIVVALISHR